ncbi:MAG TPA: endonuclease/exonuclease/phosphatase family protein [Pyrinomonadaceae bacterium]|jgi:endonuclease/exonuclease/phosphatase family metal-dependent hydrolase|nr:endonuclease/exonuclease/phosphatase family protein [Pyrinomonadaceae bacterium]
MATAIPPLKESEKIEFGSVPSSDAVGDAASIVVASYNIRYAVGSRLISGGLLRKAGLRGDSHRSKEVAHNIEVAARAFAAGQLLPRVDVLALQEADKETKRAGLRHVAHELAEALGMNWIHVPAGIPRGVKPLTRQWWLDFEEPIELYDTGDTGIGLLSNLRLGDVTRIDLPWHECPWRPRLAMGATVSVGSRSLRIVNAHVDPHAAVGGQLEQLEALVAEADKHSGPTLILGDFNTLSNTKVVETRSFLESHGYSTPFPSGTPTWRGMGIRLHADWIFHRGVKISRWGVARPLSVSDHWPIWAEVVMK